MQEPYLIDNGKMPFEPYNIKYSISLPTDTPYGNFDLKYMKIILRLDEANKQIITCYDSWNRFTSGVLCQDSPGQMHYFSCELIVYFLRRACDELISLSWCLYYRVMKNKWADKIIIDCIGEYLKDINIDFKVYDKYKWCLETMNNLANAYKHSFINSHLNIVGKYEPCLPALELKHNSIKRQPVLYNVALRELVTEFNTFFKNAVQIISEYNNQIPHNLEK